MFHRETSAQFLSLTSGGRSDFYSTLNFALPVGKEVIFST